jgi:hypothetical protein
VSRWDTGESDADLDNYCTDCGIPLSGPKHSAGVRICYRCASGMNDPHAHETDRPCPCGCENSCQAPVSMNASGSPWLMEPCGASIPTGTKFCGKHEERRHGRTDPDAA